jgi:hypothetical protein
MNTDELVETFARMSIQERNAFAETLTAKWPHLAVQISNLIDVYGMINETKEKDFAYPGSDCQV